MLQETLYFEAQELSHLLNLLHAQGYTTLAPTVRDSVITYAEIQSIQDLPQGWRDHQSPGKYRIEPSEDPRFFAYAVGPQSWKRYLHPPETTLWHAHLDAGRLQIEPQHPAVPLQAFIGVRGCELAAIARQDKILMHGPYPDPIYQARRAKTFIVAVDCHFPATTCFCTSMNTGPAIDSEPEALYDLALSEVLCAQHHGFLVRSGSESGAKLLAALKTRQATEAELENHEILLKQASEQITVKIEAETVRTALQETLRSSHWQEIAERCLSCSNCTMVCPTCFCTSVQDQNLLDGSAVRKREWDSCFSAEFSYLHGAGPVRQSTASRYRQWLTHKLSTWHDQFGESGCVGCGRCITWCPVGIDIREEAAVFANEAQKGSQND